MSKATYVEIHCKSAINRVTGMPFNWSLNPYRGCSHACHYCYARATHSYYGLNAGSDFETQIFVKTNFAEVLRKELARPGWCGEKVSLGTATDPYQPGEGKYRVTRAAIEAIRDYRNPLSIVTKSTLVYRDLDLLAELARMADVSVHFTVTTIDPIVWKAVEPGTPPPWKRLEILARLTDAGIRCGVSIAPILPGITDSEASLEAVIASAKAHGAHRIWGGTLRLVPLVKEHYFGFIQENYPELLDRYHRAYPGMNAARPYQEKIQARVDAILQRYGYGELSGRESLTMEPRPIVRLQPVEQLRLSM